MSHKNIRDFFRSSQQSSESTSSPTPPPPPRAPLTRVLSQDEIDEQEAEDLRRAMQASMDDLEAEYQFLGSSQAEIKGKENENPVTSQPSQPSQPTPKLTPGKLEVEASDDDDDASDSDSSLESLGAIIRARRAPKSSASTMASPPRSRPPVVYTSPVKKKYRFDMKSLVSQAAQDHATDESAKRVQALYEAIERDGNKDTGDDQKIDAGALVINAAMENREDGDAQKVLQALKRTEATHVHPTWYFFENTPSSSKTDNPFPAKSVKRDTWQHDLVDPRSREQTIVSGVPMDLVTMGDTLPDELVLWILDEIPLVRQSTLRSAYCDLVKLLPVDQIERLLQPKAIQKLFKAIGGTDEATDIHQRITTRTPIPDPYPDRGWELVISTLNFLANLGPYLDGSAQNHTICLIGRLLLDLTVMTNGSLLAACQAAISSLVMGAKESQWEQNVSKRIPKQQECH